MRRDLARRRLLTADAPILPTGRPASLAGVWALRGLVLAVLWWRLDPLASVAVAAVAVTLPAIVSAVKRRRRSEAVTVVALLRGVASSLRSGAALADALVETAVGLDAANPTPALRLLIDDLAPGGPVAGLRAWWARSDAAVVRLAMGGLVMGHLGGGLTAPFVDDLADLAQVRLDASAEAAAQAATARLSALLLAAAPLLVAAIGAAGSGAGSVGYLVTAPLGQACLAAGILLDLVGAAWMIGMVREVAR